MIDIRKLYQKMLVEKPTFFWKKKKTARFDKIQLFSAIFGELSIGKTRNFGLSLLKLKI